MALEQRIHTVTWDSSWEGRRLAEVLKEAAPGLSSRERVLVVANGLVSVNGSVVKDLDTELTGPAELQIDLRHGPHGAGKPRRPALRSQVEVLHDDEHLIVVSKAAGVLTDPQEEGKGGPPVVELLKHYWKSQSAKPINPVLVHRLDRDTSGLLVLAKTREAARDLQRQAAGHWMERQYRAIVEGTLRPAKGTWRSYLGEGEGGLKQVVAPATAEEVNEAAEGNTPPKPAGEAPGKLAVTHYKVVGEPMPGVSELDVRLETGRTHQIRIHCAEAGCPVVGDRVYYRLTALRQTSRRFRYSQAPRMYLHAERLKFRHPATQKWMTFRSEVPWDAEEVLSIQEDPKRRKSGGKGKGRGGRRS